MREFLIKAVIVVFLGVVRILPARQTALLSRITSRVLHRTSKKKRELAERNMELALDLDPDAIKELTRRAFGNVVMCIFEFMKFGEVANNEIEDYVEFDGLEHLDEALSAGERGAVVVSAHLGNWELLAVAMARKGYLVNAIIQRQPDAFVERLITRYREEQGLKLIERGPSLRRVYRRLRRGEVVLILADEHAGESGVMVDFLGRVTSCPVGPAVFSRRLGVPVIPAFIYRKGFLRHRLVVGEELDVEAGGEEEYIREMTGCVNRVIEEEIRAHPELWFWFFHRWHIRDRIRAQRERQGEGGGEQCRIEGGS